MYLQDAEDLQHVFGCFPFEPFPMKWNQLAKHPGLKPSYGSHQLGPRPGRALLAWLSARSVSRGARTGHAALHSCAWWGDAAPGGQLCETLPDRMSKSVSHEVFAWLLCRSWDGLHDGCQVPSTATVVALQQLLAEKAADVDNHSQRSLLGQPLQLEVHQWIAYCS